MDGNIYEKRLGTDRMFPLVFRMALPAVAAQIANLLYGIVDRIFIGHIPGIGTDALAGVGVTTSVIILISAFSSIVGGGGAPLAAIALGQGDRERAERILGNGFILLAAFTAVTSLAAYIFMKPILFFTGASGNTIGYATEYLSIIQGRPGIAMCPILIGAALNIILDAVFIFGFGMGVKGAAIATVISQACSAFWVLKFLFSSEASLNLSRKYLKFSPAITMSILGLGISPFIMASTESLVGFVLNGSLKQFGDIYVSSLTILQSAMQFGSVPITGFAQGFVPVASYNYGHGNTARVRECFRISLVTMFSFNAAVMLFLIIFPDRVASMFTSDSQLKATVSQMMPIFLSGMTIFGLQRACQNTFVALGQAKISLFIALLRKVILLVPLALFLPRFWGVKGVFAAESIADATAAICCTVIFMISFPKILKKVSSPSS